MKIGFSDHRRWWWLMMGWALMACGGGVQDNPKFGLVSPAFESLQGRSDEIKVQFKLTDMGINCEMSLSVNLKLQDSSCLTLPKGRHDYRLEYYDKTSNTLLAWAEDSFTLGDSDIDIFPILNISLDDDQDNYCHNL